MLLQSRAARRRGRPRGEVPSGDRGVRLCRGRAPRRHRRGEGGRQPLAGARAVRPPVPTPPARAARLTSPFPSSSQRRLEWLSYYLAKRDFYEAENQAIIQSEKDLIVAVAQGGMSADAAAARLVPKSSAADGAARKNGLR